jgi:AsmA protein
MKGPLKWLAAVVGVIVVLFVAAAILLPLFIDPNDYKQELVAQVKERTGRDLRIVGDIELSVFPWIGIELGKVALNNAAGFDDSVFASTDKVSIRVKLLPLFSKRLEMETVTVHGLTLNLARDASGRSNWDDLAKAGAAAGGADPAAPVGTTSVSEGQAGTAFAIGGLDIDDANLRWSDASQGQRFEIANLSLRTGAIRAGEPVDVKLALDVEVGDPAISGHVSAAGQLDYDQPRQLARVTNVEIDGEFTGKQLPGGSAHISLATDLAYDAAEKSLLVEKLQLTADDIKLTGQLRVSDIATSPTTNGSISIGEFNLKKLLDGLSMNVLQSSDPDALTRVSVQATIGAKPNQLIAKPLTIRIDDSTLTGELSLPDIKVQALRFDLALDAIDVDRYLTADNGKSGAGAVTPVAAIPVAAESTTTTATAAATGASEVPNEALRRLDVAGRMRIGKLKAANLNLSDVDISVKMKDGLIKLHPLGADFYNGTYRGNIVVDARGKTPRMTVDENLIGVLAGPLLKDLKGHDPITGDGDVNVALQMKGVSADEVKKTLNGSAAFAFTHGAINGVNIARMIREAYARIKGKALPAEEFEQKTDFSELRGSMHIVNGVATNNDFTVMTPLLRINGKGTANLPAETVDYRIKATVVTTLEGQGGAELNDLVGIPIPIHVTGSFTNPRYALDTEALAEALAKSKLQDVIDEKVGDDTVKGLLKGLFK